MGMGRPWQTSTRAANSGARETCAWHETVLMYICFVYHLASETIVHTIRHESSYVRVQPV